MGPEGFEEKARGREAGRERERERERDQARLMSAQAWTQKNLF
jgi:hypothetical protein